MRYITTLQETIAVAIADGYARATQQPTLVQLHSGVGLGNGIGMMYQAKRGGRAARRHRRRVGRPLRLDGRADGGRPRLDGAAGDEVGDPRGRPDLDAARAAARRSRSPPRRRAGPCSSRCRWTCSTPSSTEEVVPTSHPRHARRADGRGGRAARPRCSPARRGRSSIIGDGIACSGAQAELTRVAELLGAEVWGANFSEVNIDADAPALPRPARAHVRRAQPRRSPRRPTRC